jgi:arginine-tRNA-protein transferase
MTDQSSYIPDFHITIAQPCPYLPGRLERKLFTHLSSDKSTHYVDKLLRNGFRRSQNIAYLPYCNDCRACVSVRVLVDEFSPGKSFRRLKKRNSDLLARRVIAKATEEQYHLFDDYIGERHNDGGMSDMTKRDFRQMIEESIVDTFITEYRIKPENEPLQQDNAAQGQLAAAALCDRLSDGISMVYSFFDPCFADRSLGSYMILEHIEFARRQGLPYLYLGYWIDGCRKMTYKSRFKPQQQLTPDGWV